MGRLALRVQPRARRNEIAGERAGALLVRGESSRDKVVQIEGIDDPNLRRALGA